MYNGYTKSIDSGERLALLLKMAAFCDIKMKPRYIMSEIMFHV